MSECKALNVKGSVERTTKDFDAGAEIIIRERRCPKCKQIHKTTDYTQAELHRRAVIKSDEMDELDDKIIDLERRLESYFTIMRVIKGGLDSVN